MAQFVSGTLLPWFVMLWSDRKGAQTYRAERRTFHDHQALVEHLQMFEGRTVVSAEIVNCRVDDQVLAAICRSLGAPSLRLLDLSGNRITHRGVGALTALPSEHLDQWFLASNEIGDEGLRAWMRGVRVPVHVLDLGACGLTEESLRATRNSPMTREIRSLDVSWVLADADAFKAAFSARLQGLARIHAVLTKAMWEAATLADIVESAITPFGNDRIDVTGPSVALPPNIAVTISLVLHELATNAAKYGALSTPAGRIGLDWSRKGGANVELVWTERGGPPLQPPSRKGFGTRMIEASASQINGTVHIDYAPEGLRVRFEFSPPEAANRWDARGMH